MYKRQELCQEIIEEEFDDASEFELKDIPRPKEIKSILDQYVVCLLYTSITEDYMFEED